ncbi:MAG TPA: cysteine desulfurase [Erysipelothrix sp.]|nr:cysteine desulfurase [Erysipelothrix sp.]
MIYKTSFPFFKHHQDLIYFDSAATSLKPQVVIDTITHYYTHLSSNVFRGDYTLSIETSNRFENVRQKTAAFLNVERDEIIFTSGASESLNMIAFGFGHQVIEENDVILVNEAEHASNVLPWFELARQKKAKVKFYAIKDGQIDYESLEKRLQEDNVKIVSVAHVANVLGVKNDLKKLAKLVHEHDAYLMVDGAQAIGHFEIDLKEADVDFYAYSAHKMYGPTGVGILYGKHQLLEQMTPLQYGGGSNARFNVCGDISLKDIPERFESGTPNIEGVLGYGAAIDYINKVTLNAIEKHEIELRDYLLKQVHDLDHLVIYNPFTDTGLLSFNVKGIFAQDVAAYLNHYQICVRSGTHCSKLVGGVISEENTVRLSLGIYNTKEDIDQFIRVIKDITLEKTIDIYL